MSRLKLKNKSKNKEKFKVFMYICLLLVGLLLITYLRTIKLNMQMKLSDKAYKYVLSDTNHSIKKDFSTLNMFLELSTLSNINFSNPSSILFLGNKVHDYELVYDDEKESLEELELVSNFAKSEEVITSNPVVYVYNTHQLEYYYQENKEVHNIVPTVMHASYILREKLNILGVNTLVCDDNITQTLKDEGLNYNKSYTVSRRSLEKSILEYPTLEYFIDIHRDAISKDLSTTVINDISYAKIMFVVGTGHNDYEKNLEFVESLNNKINDKYPGLSRGILKKDKQSGNGIYNQDFNDKVILIEIGAYENNIEEVSNTMTAISEVIHEYIKENGND